MAFKLKRAVSLKAMYKVQTTEDGVDYTYPVFLFTDGVLLRPQVGSLGVEPAPAELRAALQELEGGGGSKSKKG